MGAKILFFDMDGTLWDIHNVVPDSTVKALNKLQEAGHKIFINTGRARGYVRDERLLSLGFDGIIAGCGTTIEIGEDLMFSRFLDPKMLAETISCLNGYGFRSILEGWNGLCLNYDEWNEDFYFKKLYRDLGSDIEDIRTNWGLWQGVCKFSSDTTGGDMKGGIAAVAEDFYPIIHNETVAEFVPHGFSKATGMDWVCEFYDCDISDTYAFGDSTNDIEMLRHAGVGVCMGNGMDEAKAIADLVAPSMSEDGIFAACKELGLI